jgi:5-methylthioribose kinase
MNVIPGTKTFKFESCLRAYTLNGKCAQDLVELFEQDFRNLVSKQSIIYDMAFEDIDNFEDTLMSNMVQWAIGRVDRSCK